MRQLKISLFCEYPFFVQRSKNAVQVYKMTRQAYNLFFSIKSFLEIEKKLKAMKITFSILLLFYLNCMLFAQNNEANFQIRTTALSWMPNGKALLLNIMKIDQNRKVAPVAKKFLYDMKQRKLNPFSIDGSGIAVAPNGKSAAYMKRNDNRIYLYHLKTKKEQLLVNDTLRKFALSWSPDGKNLLYNAVLSGSNADAVIEVCIYNTLTKQIKQITHSDGHKSYNPVWNPKNNKIVYYLEKGDNHDQIYLTDSEGSFHTNLTNDKNSHNFYPSWLDEHTIIYTQAPESIIMMKEDGSNPQKIEGVRAFQAHFNAKSGKIAYIDKDSNIMLYDPKSKTSDVILKGNQLNDSLFTDVLK